LKSLASTIDKNFLQVILGPRQVGKTTGILSYLENGQRPFHYSTADEILNPTGEWLEQQWQRARELKSPAILAIDEIQKIPDWSATVKKLWDAQKRRSKEGLTVILLGSSSLQIQAGLTESLAGRFILHRARHWTLKESQTIVPNMDLHAYLKFGGYPGSYALLDTPEQWRGFIRESIIETVITKDIFSQARVTNQSLFRQTFELLMAYPAQEISYNKLLGQLQDKGNVDLVKNYIRLFEGAFLLKTLSKYSAKEQLKRASSPKILPLCPALMTGARSTPPEPGFIFESVVGADLLRDGCEVQYWRDGKFEVDFVVHTEAGLFAIEVKSGRKRNASGLERFRSTYKKARAVFVTLENYDHFSASPRGFLQKMGS